MVKNSKIQTAQTNKELFENKILEREVDLEYWKIKELTAPDLPQGFNPQTKQPMPSELALTRIEIAGAERDITNLKLMAKLWTDKLEELEMEGVKKPN